MRSFKIVYSDGVEAAILNFDESHSNEFIEEYLQNEIKEFNENPNKQYHISKDNIIEIKTITINFENIISELDNINSKILIIKNKGIFLQDNNNNLYCIESFYLGSYLDTLIKNCEVVTFNMIHPFQSNNIKSYEKEIIEIENFIKVHKLM